ncbi:MAG TPA: GDSL-type esterase/lipase family protein [Candidatus Bathyarchaeia archaeon]|nr:GDSL-type esterase/lipase family protein [Candidatus Bathyarchaeia archaeon]
MSKAPRSRPTLAPLGIVGINLAVLAGFLLAVEMAFGEWIGAHPLGALNIPRSIHATISAAPLYAGGKEFVYRRDAMGFRGPGVDPARITVLTLGGSTTNQLYLPEEATWQAVLERSLRRDGHDVVVANAGLDGQSTVGMVADLELWMPNVPHLRPRLVLVYVGINDVYVRATWRDSLHRTKLTRELEERSALVRLWTVIAGSLEARRAGLRHRAVDFSRVTWTRQPGAAADLRRPSLADYKARLRRITALIEDLGAAPVFITQTRADYKMVNGELIGISTEAGPNGVDQGHALARINGATLEVCQEGLATCLDLATELHFEPGDFYDYEHNTPQGAERIGRWLAERLEGLV